MNPDRAPSRRFGILDSMILVAATSFGLAWSRQSADRSWTLVYWGSHSNVWSWRLLRVPYTFDAMFPVLLSWTIAFGIIAWIRNNNGAIARWKFDPPGRVLGLVSLAAATAVYAGMAVVGVINDSARGRPPEVGVVLARFFGRKCDGLAYYPDTFIEPAGIVGLSVAGTWLGLRLSGRYPRPEDWIDRLGRSIGVAWAFAAPMSQMYRIADFLQCLGIH